MIILVMGVSGSGKTTIGQLLAESLGWQFSDADSFHSPENIEKMRHGIPLTDVDRVPWLQALQTAIKTWLDHQTNVVLACSALRESYRKQLVLDGDRIHVIYLKGSHELIQQRLHQRHHHYMGENLLNSQFETLEEPTNAVFIDIAQSPQAIVQSIRLQLNLGS
jgi:gluconokinase